MIKVNVVTSFRNAIKSGYRFQFKQIEIKHSSSIKQLKQACAKHFPNLQENEIDLYFQN